MEDSKEFAICNVTTYITASSSPSSRRLHNHHCQYPLTVQEIALTCQNHLFRTDSPCRSFSVILRYSLSTSNKCPNGQAAELRFTNLGVAVDIVFKLRCLRRLLVVFTATLPLQTIVGCSFQCWCITLKSSELAIQVRMHRNDPACKPTVQLCSLRVGSTL